MAFLRICLAVALILLGCGLGARAEDAPATPSGLYDRPMLVVDPGMHTAPISSVAADKGGRWAVTGSDDKTIRVWSLPDGTLARTIRLPAGPDNVGKAYAVAISSDGSLIAVGGWTRWADADRQEQVYLFDRATGALVKRIVGLPDVVRHLTFSPDGSRLAATISGKGSSLRIYGREAGWAEVARDEAYGDTVYSASFAPDGALATTASDGKIRLYTGALDGSIRPARMVPAPNGNHPSGIAFNPNGQRLAVGSESPIAVDLLDGHTLAFLSRPNHNVAGDLYVGGLSEVG